MQLIALDTETRLIGKGQMPPPLVCAQFATIMEDGMFAWIVERAKEGYKEEILEMLADNSMTWVFHNAAFDLSVLAKEIPEAAPLIWDMLDTERVHDTMIREMLYNLTATGDIDNIEVHGIIQRAEYSLCALTKKYTGVDRSEEKEGDETVRTNYESVEDLLLEDWPDAFVEYAENDPEDTLKVFLEQEVAGKKLKAKTSYDPFVTETFRVRVHFALQMMTNHGNKMDTAKVLEVSEEFNTLYNDPKLVKPQVLSYFIDEYAKANEMAMSTELIAEAMEAYDSLPEDDQKPWVGENKGFICPAIPPLPYKTGALDHVEDCIYNKKGPNYAGGKDKKDCGCPPKMKGAEKEKGSTKALHDYVWKVALENECMDVWAGKALLRDMREEGTFKQFIKSGKVIDQQAVIDYTRAEILKEHPLTQGALSEYGVALREILRNKGDHQVLLDRIEDDLLERLERVADRPKGWRISVDDEWKKTFGGLDPLLGLYAKRKEYEKIITSYLPGLYWAEGMLNCPDMLEGETSRLAGKVPSEFVHSCFRPLKRTGRTSSNASTNGKTGKSKVYMIPSMNGQQVDPRIRPCVIARPGYKLFSIDYNGMELGTTAQKCIDLFGFSVLADVINAGRDAHSYLGMYIAQELDPWFRERTQGMETLDMYDFFLSLKDDGDDSCSDVFAQTFRDTGHDEKPLMSNFYAHFRKFAKPTGLGYPGGLGPKTFVSYAKATYGVTVDLDTAYRLRDIWKIAFPEMALYLDYVSKRCFDRDHRPEIAEDAEGKKYKKTFYSYDTPLGMHRAKTDFCACANGMALQSASAEGALLAVSEIQREIFSGMESILADVDGVYMVRPTIFIHDEILGEIKDDEFLTERIEYMQKVMKDCMEVITPDVKAGTEAAIMNRWSKAAFTYYVDGALRPYEERLELDEKEAE